MSRSPLLTALVAAVVTAPARGSDPQHESAYTRTADVVYGRRDGLALTLDAFTPKKPNGAAVVLFVSAGYRSGPDLLERFHPHTTTPFLSRGYTVFAVLHASAPKYTVPEIVEDAHRAVRFVRHSAERFGIDPERIGAAGASAGGHLCLMVGCAGRPNHPESADPVERQHSRANAVACFFPPTDFLALDAAGKGAERAALPSHFASAFDFREPDPATGLLVPVSAARRREIGRELSPLTRAAKGAAPTFIVHGDADDVVPIDQSRRLIARLKECGVTCELAERAKQKHFGPWALKELPALAEWFDKALAAKK